MTYIMERNVSMLNPSQVKPFILHPETIICNAAIEYFADSCLYEQDLMPLFLERMKSGLEGLHLFHAIHFPQTAETLTELFRYVGNPALDINHSNMIQQIISNSDLLLLESFRDKFKHLLAVYPLLIERRMKLAEMRTSELWDHLGELCRYAEGKYANEFRYSDGVLIIREIGKRPDTDPADVLKLLDPALEGYELEYATLLAGEMKMRETIPTLVGFLGNKGDLLPQNAVDALVRMGSAQAVEEIVRRFPEEEWDFRLFAGDVLGRLKLPESERALLHLLPNESDLSIATQLANGLCLQLSGEGIPLVARQIEQGYDSGMLNLKEALYVNCTMNKVDMPELKAHISEKKPRALNSKGFPIFTPPVTVDKIGRNDPCTCGSGKKYKKCCGA